MITYRCLPPFDIGVVEREQNVIHKLGPVSEYHLLHILMDVTDKTDVTQRQLVSTYMLSDSRLVCSQQNPITSVCLSVHIFPFTVYPTHIQV